MRMQSRWILPALGFAVVTLAVGCTHTPKPRAYTIEVSLAPELASTSLEVDLIGANESLSQTLAGKSVSEYFRPGDRTRQSVNAYTMKFRTEDSGPQTLALKHEKWDQWLGTGAKELFVIAYLPGSFEDKPGPLDERRLILPLMDDRWEGTRIKIKLKRGLVERLTPMKQPKQ